MRPRHCRELDFETELAVVIGRRCKNVSESEAYSYVAGYTILNDVNARDIGTREREGGDVFLAKTFDTFAPMGPWMVTREAIPIRCTCIQSRVNGEQRQDGNTNEMIHSIPKLISYLSRSRSFPETSSQRVRPAAERTAIPTAAAASRRCDRVRDRRDSGVAERGCR